MANQRLWAPWRMAYIENDTQPTPDQGCFLCEAVGNEDPLLLFADDRTQVMLNRFPYANGHLLVAPRQHRADYGDLPDGLAVALDRLVRRSVAAIAATMDPDGFNVGMNLGVAAGAGVPDHLHVHVVPRWAGDTNFMPVVGDTKVLPELLADTAAKLRPQFEKEGDRP